MINKAKWGLPKIRGPFLVVPIIGITVYWGPYWGPLILQKLLNSSTVRLTFQYLLRTKPLTAMPVMIPQGSKYLIIIYLPKICTKVTITQNPSTVLGPSAIAIHRTDIQRLSPTHHLCGLAATGSLQKLSSSRTSAQQVVACPNHQTQAGWSQLTMKTRCKLIGIVEQNLANDIKTYWNQRLTPCCHHANRPASVATETAWRFLHCKMFRVAMREYAVRRRKGAHLPLWGPSIYYIAT